MKDKKYLSVTAMVMIIFVGVFGFGNIANNFKASGTQSTGMFLLGALLCFLPTCLIMSEFAAFAKDRTGGIYSWIEIGAGKDIAYLGLWSYFVANIFYLPTLASRVPTYLSFTLTGDANIGDTPMAIMSAGALVAALLIGLKFESKFTKVSTITGYISLFVSIIFILGGLGLHMGIFGEPATTLSLDQMMFKIDSKDSIGEVVSTFAWIIFAFGGAEMVGTYVDKVRNPERDFVRGILLAALVIGVFYILGIIAISAYGTADDFGAISLVNAVISGYAFMGNSFGLGVWFVKLIGLAYSIITLVALILWSLALSKVVFSEAPKGTFPEWMTRKNKSGILKNALIFQTSLAFLFMLITTFGGSAAGDLYYKIYDMSTMAFIMPYLFLGIAYIGFRRKGYRSSFQLSSSNTVAYIVGGLVIGLYVLALVFSGYDMNTPIREQMGTIKLYYGGLTMFMAIGIVIRSINIKRSLKKIS